MGNIFRGKPDSVAVRHCGRVIAPASHPVTTFGHIARESVIGVLSCTRDVNKGQCEASDHVRVSSAREVALAGQRIGNHTISDTRAILTERTSQRVCDLIQDAAATQSVKGSTAQNVGDYYAGFKDEEASYVERM